MTPKQKKYYNEVIKECKQHDIVIELVDKKYVSCDGVPARGFFDCEKRKLVVATKKDLVEWFPIFLHETSHFDQWKKNTKIWKAHIKGKHQKHDPLSLYELYIDGVIELTDEIKKQISIDTANIEFDCEKRTVRKMKALDFTKEQIEHYCKVENLYIILYPFCLKKRRWIGPLDCLKKNKKLYDVLPNKLFKKIDDYVNIPEEIKIELEKVFEVSV